MSAQLLGWLFDATVKGSVVIAIVALLQLAIGARIGARWRHALWLVVLLRLAIPVAPSSSWSVFNLLTLARPAIAAPTVVQTVSFDGRLDRVAATDPVILKISRPTPITSTLLALWLLGVAALLARAAIGAARTHRAIARARRTVASSDRRLAEVVDEARRRLNIRRTVEVLECGVVSAPALHGIVHPTLLFPSGAAATFTRDELRHIVLHELWHLRRGDVAVNLVLSSIEALHWFNPLVWFAMTRIREEREMACDELALSCLEEEERPSYGMTILKLLARFRTAAAVPALVGIVNQKQQMKRRLTMIARFSNRTRRFSILFLGAVALVSTVALTDARAGERIFKHLDPASHATAEKLHQRVSVNLSNATLGELLNSVSSSSGVVITQSPDVATSKAQQARFTLEASNTPGHVILHEALMPFGLMPKAEANGVSIVKAEGCEMGAHHMRVEKEAATGGEEKKVVVRTIVKDGEKVDDAELHQKMIAEHHGDGAEMKRVMIHKMGPGECKLDENGKLTRSLTMKFDENGVVSEGKMKLEIQAPPEK